MWDKIFCHGRNVNSCEYIQSKKQFDPVGPFTALTQSEHIQIRTTFIKLSLVSFLE